MNATPRPRGITDHVFYPVIPRRAAGDGEMASGTGAEPEFFGVEQDRCFTCGLGEICHVRQPERRRWL